MTEIFASPFVVPVAVFMFLAITGVAGIIGQAHARRLKAEQRMAMVQRGMTPEQIATVLSPTDDDKEHVGRTKDPLRSLANARRTGIVLVSVGAGIIIFGLVLTMILQVREVLSVAACGFIPFAIGVGFFVDYNLQKRELARFGMEVDADQPHDPSR
jgi:Flp pilus assembly protein TadB